MPINEIQARGTHTVQERSTARDTKIEITAGMRYIDMFQPKTPRITNEKMHPIDQLERSDRSDSGLD